MEKVLGWTVNLVERPRKPALEAVLKLWAAERAKEGEKVDWQRLMPPRGFHFLPRRLGSGADVLLDRSQYEDEQGL